MCGCIYITLALLFYVSFANLQNVLTKLKKGVLDVIPDNWQHASLRYCKQLKLDSGKAWEWGYHIPRIFAMHTQ